ncbi:MAG: Type 4 prepilin-like proteins leader peptide-processing enzyme [Lentisphaerae bacterium ADurb.Bin242]|nr:MAG: Type 4 prepilin-like proteins leader peptide-processing enzyme [Lentisphaerae bacterium ADurb.Bin242]
MTLHELFGFFRTDPRFFTFGMVSAFALGCCIGSFLNVCIWRVPRGMSIISPPSHCPKCGHSITPLENIPLLSWIFLGGKCSSCKQPITIRYFLVELTSGLLFSMIFLTVIVRALPPSAILFYWIAASILLCSAFTDCELGIIPNEFTCFGIAMGLILSPLCPSYWQVSSRPTALLLCLGSILIAGGMMAGCSLLGKWIFKREALGWGDVKLVAAAAALLGLPGALFTVIAGSLLGLIGFPVLRLTVRKYRHRRSLKFAPFLAVGGMVWIFYANRLVDLVIP